MKNEILIGREAGKVDYQVDESYKSVSRQHAKIIRKPGGIYIEDLDSAHGTFVNGSRVKTKKIGRSDSVSLGGPNGYILDINAVLATLPMSNEEFSEKVRELKGIFETHRKESARIHSQMSSTMMIRMAPTFVLGALTTLVSLSVGDNAATKTAIAASGAVLTILVFALASWWATKRNRELKEELQNLDDKFELEYVCPKCSAMFRGKSWETLRRSGKCHSCKTEFNL